MLINNKNKMEEQKKENNNKLNFNNMFLSKGFKISLISIVSVIFLLLILQLGIIIGSQKARFSYKWEDNYCKNFVAPREFPGDDNMGPSAPPFMNAFGVSGSIITINDASIVIKDKDNIEKIVLIKDDTVIRRAKENIKITDLVVDDNVVIMGNPTDSGEIEAKLIRVFDKVNDANAVNSNPVNNINSINIEANK